MKTTDLLTTLATRSLDAQAEAARRYREWLGGVSERVDARAAGGLPHAYLRLAEGMADAAVGWLDSLRDSAASTAGADPEAAPSRPDGAATELRLHAEPGADARGSLIVENHHPVAADVSFLVSEFTPDDGSPGFRPPLDIEPSRLVLAAGEERSVAVRVPLDPARFVAGRRYAATLAIRGLDQRDVRLLVTVDRLADS